MQSHRHAAARTTYGLEMFLIHLALRIRPCMVHSRNVDDLFRSFFFLFAVRKLVLQTVFSPHHNNNIMFLNWEPAELLDAACVCDWDYTQYTANAAAFSLQPPAVLHPP